jgi:hypothetical protein
MKLISALSLSALLAAGTAWAQQSQQQPSSDQQPTNQQDQQNRQYPSDQNGDRDRSRRNDENADQNRDRVNDYNQYNNGQNGTSSTDQDRQNRDRDQNGSYTNNGQTDQDRNRADQDRPDRDQPSDRDRYDNRYGTNNNSRLPEDDRYNSGNMNSSQRSGFRDGMMAGRSDHAKGRGFSPSRYRRSDDAGHDQQYRQGYREGYQRGYYGNNDNNSQYPR